jgi:hypothetical protein
MPIHYDVIISALAQVETSWRLSWRRWARQSCRWKIGLRSEERQNNELGKRASCAWL